MVRQTHAVATGREYTNTADMANIAKHGRIKQKHWGKCDEMISKIEFHGEATIIGTSCCCTSIKLPVFVCGERILSSPHTKFAMENVVCDKKGCVMVCFRHFLPFINPSSSRGNGLARSFHHNRQSFPFRRFHFVFDAHCTVHRHIWHCVIASLFSHWFSDCYRFRGLCSVIVGTHEVFLHEIVPLSNC